MVRALAVRTGAADAPPVNILEIGAGTGPMTDEILTSMRPADHLDVVEIHRKFYEHIKNRYGHRNLTAHCCDILDFQPGLTYDIIISSLPYENIPAESGQKIWERKISLCKPGGTITYFKYLSPFGFKHDFERDLVEKWETNRETVLRNLPPARVYTLRIEGNGLKRNNGGAIPD